MPRSSLERGFFFTDVFMKPPTTQTKPTPPNQSFKVEVEVGREWSTNGCRYATREEAEAAGNELLSRWFVPTDSRAVESPDPVNWRFDFETYRGEMLPEPKPEPVAIAA